MKVVSLASGSKGNACLVTEGEASLLIDCGLNFRTLGARLAAAGAADALAHLVGVLVTHSHGDHVSGIERVVRGGDVPVYANALTAETLSVACHVPDAALACFENGQEFEAGPFVVHPFSIPHDTADPVGYLVAVGGETYFHGTDIGSPLDAIGVKLAEADYATVESNHDPVLLRTSGRPPSTIQRIAGPRGHLSNDEACALVARFASPKLKTLALGHLSQDCNAPQLAAGAMRRTLDGLRRTDVALKVLSQDLPVALC